MAGLAHRDDRQGFHVAKAALAVTVDDDLANFGLLCFGAIGHLDIESSQLPRRPGVRGAGCRVTRLQADRAESPDGLLLHFLQELRCFHLADGNGCRNLHRGPDVV